MVVSLLPWRWGVSGMSNLIVGVYRGDGVGGLRVRDSPLTTGARRVWNRPLLKPLKEEESNCYTVKETTGGLICILLNYYLSYHVHNILPGIYLMMILEWIKMLQVNKQEHQI